MKILLIDLAQSENLTHSKVNRFLRAAGIFRRASMLGGQFLVYGITRAEADSLVMNHPSPIEIEHVKSRVFYHTGSAPQFIRDMPLTDAGCQSVGDDKPSK